MSRYRDSGSSDCKLYVGDLGSAASKQELEEAFSYYGPLRNVWVARNPPGFAFVEFEDPRDAEDAVRGLDGRTICGRRVRVEPSNGMGGKGRFRGPPPRRGRPFHPEDRCYECGERGHYARDCYRYRSGGRSSRRRSYSRSRSRSRSRDRRSRSRSASRSRSRDRGRSKSRTPRDRSRTPKDRSSSRTPRDRSPRDRSPRDRSPRDRSRSRTPNSKSRSPSRSRSRARESADKNANTQNDARD
ncbi:serine/arginine-rich splicing factor 3-like isoform X2 [Bacillus rossius redtenbacheri]|uniref:serine/arginine-rich splicing factor 3-like isoform X2 n=2 Tax=Bacillus rossius redtenbacheri TaxID=93214 RepID=UPI002FDC85A0